MKVNLIQDDMGTHIDWQHESVTPKMIDWFWSNMEKAMLLWHPAQHEPLEWEIPPVHGNPVGSIHIAPQTWNDGTRQNLYIRFEDLKDVPAEVKKYIVYEHCVVVAGLGLGNECLKNPDPMGYRIHQWEKTDYGVRGKSSAIGMRKKETKEEGLIWADHCMEEVGNWGVFLPALYDLYKVVKNTDYNPYADLSVEGQGEDLRYKYIK
ncbi:hypothetical protein [Alkalibacter mobilis]|uniref:hypothetical protein n=1 Tax=Alkalibacter mobilis TaxID=2787712 RepID=UPI00189F7925|nr:hypothetical protein [Alkalibacter mobilis]MBF7095606.1 hypothetical protein [Alkalibacter mobilis]